MFIAEVEVIRSEMQERDVTVEGEFLSDQQMIDEGISEQVGLNKSPVLLRIDTPTASSQRAWHKQTYVHMLCTLTVGRTDTGYRV